MTTYNRTLTVCEIAKFRIVYTLKLVIGISKKIVMRASKTMKNGALQFSYLVDGIKCSCFVKKAYFERQCELVGTQYKTTFEDSLLETIVFQSVRGAGFSPVILRAGYTPSTLSLFPHLFHKNKPGLFVRVVNDLYVIYKGVDVRKLEYQTHAETIEGLLARLKAEVRNLNEIV